MNPTIDENYPEAKRRAKKFYAGIGSVWCVALGGYVNFNNMGFRHLVRKRGKRRSNDEQMRRFVLLKYAPDMLTNPGAVCIHSEGSAVRWSGTRKKKTASTSRADFWAFKETKSDRTVTVVIRKIGKGRSHFFSIF